MSLVDFLPTQGYVEISLRKTATGLIEVEAKVNGEEALLYLDTGAGRTVFDEASAKRLHLELRASKAKAAGLGSSSHPVQTGIVDELTIGSFRITSLKTVVMDLSHVNEARAQIGSAACDGVIGADILGGKSAVIDYGSYKLYLRDES
jgi:predicted aspartyl protease